MGDIIYNIIGKSITGASHTRAALPNQDSIAYAIGDDTGNDFAFGIVSDGHGSKKYFRSHIGSSVATDVLSVAFNELGRIVNEHTNRQVLRQYVLEHLPKIVVDAWREKISDHLDRYPYTQDDLNLLAPSEPALSAARFEKLKYIPYGATLLGVLILNQCIIYVQLGDGDILLAYPDGQVYRRITTDDRLMGNDTTSLCLDTAPNDFRSELDFIVGTPPPILLITTDGFVNAYKEDEGLFSFLRDVSKLLDEKGVAWIEENLTGWLEDTSVQATGDDTSMCLIMTRRKDPANDIKQPSGLKVSKGRAYWANKFAARFETLLKTFTKT